MLKLDGKTQDLISENITKLKDLFPEAFKEGKIDFEALRLILGDEIDTENERYSFTWHGKSEAIKLALKQSTGTLRPCKEESKHWDTTQNLFIESDNLEVLRILQSSYRNKIKMIYIDPPYNTGHDFIYEDDFKDNVKHYKEKVSEAMKANLDIGFKVFKLDETNFTQWDEETTDPANALLRSVQSIKANRTSEDALYEILLKYGIDLTLPVTELEVDSKKVFSLAANYLLVCLEKNLSLSTIEEIAKLKPKRVVFYDEVFKDDVVKLNAEQTLRKFGVEDLRVI